MRVVDLLVFEFEVAGYVGGETRSFARDLGLEPRMTPSYFLKKKKKKKKFFLLAEQTDVCGMRAVADRQRTAASSAVPTLEPSWATTKPPCSACGGKSEAKSNRKTLEQFDRRLGTVTEPLNRHFRP